jgi:hypothetical protein
VGGLNTRKNYNVYNDTRHIKEKETIMSVKTVMANISANKKIIIKRSLIVVGAAAGLALTAGLIIKSKNSVDSLDAVEAVIDAVEAA